MNDCGLATQSLNDHIKNQLLLAGMSNDSHWEIKKKDSGGVGTYSSHNVIGEVKSFKIREDMQIDSLVELDSSGFVKTLTKND
jgi:hypothetical protein